LTELVSLPDRDVERIQRAVELIRDGLPSLPPDIGDELEAVGREWQAVRPDLVLIYELGSDDPLVGEAESRIEGRIGELVRALGGLQGAIGARLQAQRGRLLYVRGSIALASLVLFGFGLWSTNRYIARPIRKLEEASRRVSLGDFSERVPIVASDPFENIQWHVGAAGKPSGKRREQRKALPGTVRQRQRSHLHR
jgi:HAMP domain-containing protein